MRTALPLLVKLSIEDRQADACTISYSTETETGAYETEVGVPLFLTGTIKTSAGADPTQDEPGDR